MSNYIQNILKGTAIIWHLKIYKKKNADTQLHRSFIQIHMYMCTHFGCRLLDELTIAT